jgi:S1-C subfamily serine protease
VTRFVRSPFASAILGGAVVAAALLAFDVGGSTHTRTIVEQAALGGASNERAAGDAALTPHDIYERVAPGVVFVRATVVQDVPSPFDPYGQASRSEATGSGFVVDRRGRILTNYHVVAGASRVTVAFADKRTVTARVVGTDPSNDLAVLAVDPSRARLAPLALGRSRTVRVGDPTLAIGNPFGLDRTLTSGIVSALQRQIQAPDGFTIDHVIQTDAAINPGNSGGPLLDAAGRVIGINSQIETGGSGNGNIGIGFAVPIDTAKRLLPELEKTGRVDRGFLGVDALTIDDSLSDLNLPVDRGVLVQTVTPGSPAAKAGIMGGDIVATLDGNQIRFGGDIITAVDGKKLRTREELAKAISDKGQGDKVKIELVRDGKKHSVEVTLAARPPQTTGTG